MNIPKTYRGKVRRQAIVETASRLFLEKGYSATSINEIVRCTGGSLSTVYKWFSKKESLFWAVLENELEKARSFIEILPLTGKNPHSALQAATAQIYGRGLERLIHLFLLEGYTIPVLHKLALESFRENLQKPIEKWLLRFERRFQVRFLLGIEPTAEIFVRHIRGSILEFVLSSKDMEKRKEEVASQTTELFLALLRPEK